MFVRELKFAYWNINKTAYGKKEKHVCHKFDVIDYSLNECVCLFEFSIVIFAVLSIVSIYEPIFEDLNNVICVLFADNFVVDSYDEKYGQRIEDDVDSVVGHDQQDYRAP